MTIIHPKHLLIADPAKLVSLLGVLADQLFLDVFLRVVSTIFYEKGGLDKIINFFGARHKTQGQGHGAWGLELGTQKMARVVSL